MSPVKGKRKPLHRSKPVAQAINIISFTYRTMEGILEALDVHF
jgi:hypothetical protein